MSSQEIRCARQPERYRRRPNPSDMTLSAVMRRIKVDAVPHGFRLTLRDWCAERTDFAREVAEMALAHAIGDKVEAASSSTMSRA